MNKMDEEGFGRLEAQLRQAAANFEYPPTPDGSVFLPVGADLRVRPVARLQTPRRRAWVAALIVAALLAALLSVPRVRAAVAEFIQIGVVRIFQGTPENLPEIPALPPTQIPTTKRPSEAVPTVTEELELGRLVPPGELTGATTLEAARNAAPFPVLLPEYPPNLGAPDGIYLQNLDGFMLVLVWNDPDRPDRPALSLHAIQSGSWTITKIKPQVVQETSVGGRPAVWAVGPYFVLLHNGNSELGRLVDGNVLIWEQDGLTYRLETDLPLEEAIKIAESLL